MNLVFFRLETRERDKNSNGISNRMRDKAIKRVLPLEQTTEKDVERNDQS